MDEEAGTRGLASCAHMRLNRTVAMRRDASWRSLGALRDRDLVARRRAAHRRGAFAGGAVLASLADTLMPEAFEYGRPLNSMATTARFLLSFVLSL